MRESSTCQVLLGPDLRGSKRQMFFILLVGSVGLDVCSHEQAPWRWDSWTACAIVHFFSEMSGCRMALQAEQIIASLLPGQQDLAPLFFWPL